MPENNDVEAIKAAMADVANKEAELEAALQRRTELAASLYRRNGATCTYTMGTTEDGHPIEMFVQRSKPRRDGTSIYFLTEKQRWPGKARLGRVQEAVEAVRASGVPLTGRVIEATASLTGRSEAGRQEGTEEALDLTPAQAVIQAVRDAATPRSNEAAIDLTRASHGDLVQAILDNAIPRRDQEHMQAVLDAALGVREHRDAAIEAGEKLLKSLSPEELAGVEVPSRAEIEAAVKRGLQDAGTFMKGIPRSAMWHSIAPADLRAYPADIEAAIPEGDRIRGRTEGVSIDENGGFTERRLLQIQEPGASGEADDLGDILASLED